MRENIFFVQCFRPILFSIFRSFQRHQTWTNEKKSLLKKSEKPILGLGNLRSQFDVRQSEKSNRTDWKVSPSCIVQAITSLYHGSRRKTSRMVMMKVKSWTWWFGQRESNMCWIQLQILDIMLSIYLFSLFWMNNIWIYIA